MCIRDRDGAEGGVTAVVRPVGIDQADFGNGRVALFRFEVVLAEHNVGVVHDQALFIAEILQRSVIQSAEAVQGFHLSLIHI